mgnify:CR=1 FL=1
MRWHQNNIFKHRISYWKRFIRTDYMTTGLIDVDSEMIQPNRFWLMIEDKNYRKKSTDAGDAFQEKIMQERADSSKIPFLGIFTVNKNEQSPYIFLNQSKVIKCVSNVTLPHDFINGVYPTDIVFYKWLEINNLFESEEERITFIKKYNNNVKKFITSSDLQQLRTSTFDNSVESSIESWGVNNKMFFTADLDNEKSKSFIKQIKEFFLDYFLQDSRFNQNCNTPTYEQSSGDFDEVYFLTNNGNVQVTSIKEILQKWSEQ